MSDFKWEPPYITLEVAPVTILPPTKEMIREHYSNLLDALNLPIGSGVHRVGKLATNDDFHLNERHFYSRTKGFHDE